MLHSPFQKSIHRTAISLFGTLSIVIGPAVFGSVGVGLTAASAQTPADAATTSPAPTEPPIAAPTARYANGEDVDLADIIVEWRGYYSDVPVYLCICQDSTCNQSEQWPYREYDRYQFSVALGPNNGQATEANGFNCFDISDGSRPSNPRDFSTALATDETISSETASASEAALENRPAPSRPIAERPIAAPVSPPVPADSPELNVSDADADTEVTHSSIPTATTINNGTDIRLDWPNGRSDTLNVTTADRAWNINILNALDCESLSAVSEKTMSAQRVVGSPAVDQITGYVAVPVLLDSCIETDQMAVFIVEPAEGGSYKLYRTQLPSVRGLSASQDVIFPDESSSYAYSTIVEMRYWDSTLLVRQADASGATVISIFRPGPTPAGIYAGCGVVSEGEGATALCNQ